MDIQLGVEATPVAEGIYEVAVTATVQTKIQDKTVFLVEAKQAGIFEIRNVPEDQMGGVIGIACPRSSIPTCAATWPTWSHAPASRPCTWPKSTSRPCTSSSRQPPRRTATRCRSKPVPSRPMRFAPRRVASLW